MNLDLGPMPAELKALAKEWPMVFMLKLPPKATIVVAGCYEGKSIDLLRWVYPDYGRIVGFDLQKEACEVARAKFALSDNIEIINTGLAGYYPTGVVTPANYGSIHTSVVDNDPSAPLCTMVPAGKVFNDLGLGDSGIDLLLMNIEGYEYHLLNYLNVHRWYDISIRGVAVQFHPTLKPPDAVPLRQLFDELHVSFHKEIDQYPQWVYWRKRE